MRLAARTDANHTAIVEALRGCGASVLSLAAIAGGCPDLLVGWKFPNGERVNLLIEVKNEARSPSKRRLTPDQREFHAAWRGQVVVVDSVNAAIQLLRLKA